MTADNNVTPPSRPAPAWSKIAYIFVALALVAFIGYFIVYNIYAFWMLEVH